MRLGRMRFGEKEITGRLDGGRIHPVDWPGSEPAEEGAPLEMSRGRLLAPCRPGKIVAVGLNYRDHALERGKPLPSEPLIFLKAPSAVIGPDDPILLPPGVGRVDHEAELAIVIGKRAKNLAVALAGEAVAGYTCFNDVTARELQDRDVQYTRAKGFDTFAPVGPWIETDVDPSDLVIEARVNGIVRQRSSTRELIFPPAFLVAYISRIMTLEPGDLIATGTPSGIGPLSPGDTVEIILEGIGTLANPVRAA